MLSVILDPVAIVDGTISNCLFIPLTDLLNVKTGISVFVDVVV